MQSLAVLPFRSLAEGGEDADLQVGIADALISKLSNVKQLTLKPTSAVRKYAGSTVDPQSVGRELDVDAVVDGSIQRNGETNDRQRPTRSRSGWLICLGTEI
jgi:TolB-like protein